MIITELWRRMPGKYFCVSTKSASGNWKDTFFKREELKDVRGFLKDNEDKDCYFCVHGLSEPRRKKECAELPKMLWSDMDEVDPRKVKAKPTIAIESSPGRYVGLWILDSVMTESVNRRLSYLMGADKGGWDLTQVLRIPGTRNYKYQSTPRVRLLWDDGPVHKLRDIEKLLPEDEEDEAEGADATAILMKYEKTMSASTRHELMKGRPTPGKRSEVLWRLGNELIEAGVTRGHAFTLLRQSPWNKFAGRSSEVDQLNRELDKIYGRKFGGKKWEHGKENGDHNKNGYKFLEIAMNEVTEENIDWLWYPYLARGEMTIVEGDPGIGKSYLMQMISKGICDGEKLPSMKPAKRLETGKVAYFDIENNAGSVTKKRLKYNDCQHMENFFQEEEPFSIDNEEALGHVYEAIEKLRPAMIVFDTINLYIGKADTAKGSETTQALAKFKDMAKRFNCSVVIVRHLTKGSNVTNALYRGQGNMAFAGMARIIISVGRDPEDPETKVVAVTKLNLAKHPKALTFTVDSLPDTLKDSDRSKFTWGNFVDLSADEVLSVAKPKSSEEKNGAIKFLHEELATEGKKIDDLEIMAEKRSISLRTLHRAGDEIGVLKKLYGFGSKKYSVWSLARMGKN